MDILVEFHVSTGAILGAMAAIVSIVAIIALALVYLQPWE